MSRKNSPNKQPQKLGPPQQVPPPQPVTMGNVAIQCVRELESLFEELGQRRPFDEDVGLYLKQKGLIDDFNAWRTALHAPPAVSEPKKA